MLLRPPTPADVPSLVQMLNLSLEFDHLSCELVQEKLFGDPDFNPDLCKVAQHQGIMGLVQALLRPKTKTGFIKLFCVNPIARRLSLGTRLLDAVECELKSQGAERVRICESAPNYLLPGLDIRYTPALLMLEKRGYKKIGETYNLHCPLQQSFSTDSDELRLTSQGITVALAAQPLELIDFIRRFFPAWEAEVNVMLTNEPVSIYVARSSTELLGFAGYDGNNLGTGWFGPMGTHPERRGLGIGGVLYKKVLQEFQRQGLTSCTIPWVGPYGFYASHSPARLDRVFWRLEKSL
jgi:mycothiol synthase